MVSGYMSASPVSAWLNCRRSLLPDPEPGRLNRLPVGCPASPSEPSASWVLPAPTDPSSASVVRSAHCRPAGVPAQDRFYPFRAAILAASRFHSGKTSGISDPEQLHPPESVALLPE